MLLEKFRRFARTVPPCKRPALPLVCAALVLRAGACHAVLPDEIQVYIDDLNDPGRFGLEVHVNTTPDGRSTPEYAGEVTPAHGLRLTPEFSYGLTDSLELGAYLPTERTPQGDWDEAGIKARLKWVPMKAERNGGYFAGLNGELAQVPHRFEPDQRAFELRPFLGWRDERWLLAANPVVHFSLGGPGAQTSRPDLQPCVKLSRTVAGGVAAGVEYYADLGAWNDVPALPQQQHTLYLAFDIERKPWSLNLGIGRGLTAATDAWTLKAIVEIPIDD